MNGLMVFTNLCLAVLLVICVIKFIDIKAPIMEDPPLHKLEEIPDPNLYTPRNVIPVLLRGLDNGSEEFNKALLAIMELYPKKILGLNNNVYLESGRIIQPELDLEFVWSERKGRQISRLLEIVMKEQETVRPGMDILFIEPDHEFRKVVKAWKCEAITVKEINLPPSKRDVTAVAEIVDVTARFEVARYFVGG